MPMDKPMRRKKRISFELDPLFNLMNSFPEMFGETLGGPFEEALEDA